VVWAVAVSGLMGLGIGAVMPTSLVAAQSQAAGRDLGAATGILLLMRSLGGAFGATLAGAVLAGFAGDVWTGFRVGFLAGGVMLAAAAAAAWRMENFVLRGTTPAGAGE
jgi:MFS family permease